MISARIGTRIMIATVVAALATSAFYARAGSFGYTFATFSNGSFNLKIDSKATWNGVLQPSSTWTLKNLVPGVDKFFNIGDVKPGDQGEATISFHVNKDAWICLDFENLKQKENGRNEPELLVDPTGGPTSGELAAGTEFFAWYDDGDNLFEVGEKPIFGSSTDKQAATITLSNKTYALADSISGTAFPANQTKYIGVQWCAGNMEVNVATAVITCDPTTMGNETQTDSFSVDIGFRAVPKKDNKNFTCKKNNTTCVWPNPVSIVINNNAVVNSTTTSSSNTGGNNAGAGGTVVTGNATSNSSSTNIINRIIERFR